VDYLVLWGGKLKGRERLYQTGSDAAHDRIVADLKAGKVVNWKVEEKVKEAAKEEGGE